MFTPHLYWKCLGLALGATLLSGLAADDRLSIELVDGEVIAYQRKITGGQDIDNAGFKMTFQHEHNQQFRVTVRDADDKGYSLDVILVRAWGWDQIPFGEPEKYDSAADGESDENKFLKVVGTTVRTRVTRDGMVVDVPKDAGGGNVVAVEFLASALASFPRVSLDRPEVWTTTIEEDIAYSVVRIEIQHEIQRQDPATIEVRSAAKEYTEKRTDNELQPIIGMLEAQVGELGIADVTAEASSSYSRSDGLPVTVSLETRMSYGVRDKNGKYTRHKDFDWVLTETEEIARVQDFGADAE